MKNLLYIYCLLLCLCACQSNSSGNAATEAARIQKMQQEIGASTPPPAEKLDSLLSALESYAATWPNDTRSANYLSQAAETARLLRKYDKALTIYDRMIKAYSGQDAGVKALFMKGFTLDNDMKQLDSARVVYEAFLEKYPNDGFADDAHFLLNNLGKSPEEIIESFEKK